MGTDAFRKGMLEGMIQTILKIIIEQDIETVEKYYYNMVEFLSNNEIGNNKVNEQIDAYNNIKNIVRE